MEDSNRARIEAWVLSSGTIATGCQPSADAASSFRGCSPAPLLTCVTSSDRDTRQADGAVKPGVDFRQAQLAQEKLEPSERILLNSHVASAQHCQKLSPTGLKTASRQEVLQSMQELEGLGLGWPLRLRLWLWQKQVVAKIEAVKQEMRQDSVLELLDCALPFPLTEEGMSAQWDRTNPKLASMDMEPVQKVEKAWGALASDLLIPMLLEGSAYFIKLQAMSAYVLEVSNLLMSVASAKKNKNCQ